MRRWAIAALCLLVGAGCSTGAPAAGSASPPDGGPIAVTSPSASPVASTAASASVPASVPAPESESAPPSAVGGVVMITCPKLVSDAEMQDATGIPDIALFGDPSKNAPDGLIDCGYFGRKGALYVQVTIWSGPSKAGFDQLWDASVASPAAQHLAGIGDDAAFGASGDQANGGAKVGNVGVSVVFQQMADGGIAGIDLKAAVTKLLIVAVSRV